MEMLVLRMEHCILAGVGSGFGQLFFFLSLYLSLFFPLR